MDGSFEILVFGRKRRIQNENSIRCSLANCDFWSSHINARVLFKRYFLRLDLGNIVENFEKSNNCLWVILFLLNQERVYKPLYERWRACFCKSTCACVIVFKGKTSTVTVLSIPRGLITLK